MAFVVEDGTGIDDATSYCTVAEFRTYHADVGYDFSGYSDPQIRVALVKATRYVESRFRNRFFGYRETDSQALSWPRVGVVINYLPVDGTVPQELKNAINEYAKRALPSTAELQPDPADFDATQQIVKRAVKQVGPIRTEVEYQSGGAPILKAYPAADQWLANLMYQGDECMRV